MRYRIKINIMEVEFSNSEKSKASEGQLKRPVMPTPFEDSSLGIFQNIKLKRKVLDRLMDLEGQCRIDDYEFLQLNLCKGIILMMPIVATVFGLFILKYYPSFRALVFYDSSKREEATHIMIKNNEGNEEIVKIDDIDEPIKFTYKKLKYMLHDNQPIPMGFCYEDEFEQIFEGEYRKIGLQESEAAKNKERYGTNEHKVSVPSFPEYLLDVLTTPFFLLQYVFCFVYFLQGYAAFSIALLVFSIVTTTVNYIMMYISYKRIKEIAERHFKVKVLREGRFEQIDNVELVPGDVFEPYGEIPCDAMVLSGDIYVNEANLTGESYPIGKFPVTTIESTDENNTWLFEGSKVLESRTHSLAVVINIGFQTCRGRIIRKILTRERRQPDIFRSAIVFVTQAVIVSIVAFCCSLPILLTLDIEPLFIFFKLFDFLGSAAPPPLPIFFNVAYSFALTRLGLKDISGTQPQQTVNGAYTKILCFDKTGTLTETDVEIQKVYRVEGEKVEEVTDKIHEPSHSLIMKLFASCHTVKDIEGKLLGDEIDKEMYFTSKYHMSQSSSKEIKFMVESNDNKLQILRINQFESKFQSMSVLVKDVTENKVYVFLKGAPERVIRNSINKNATFLETVKQLSFAGLRTIGFAYKRIDEKDIGNYLLCSRDDYEYNVTALGLVAFDNKLKEDASDTMEKLYQSNIDPKMITGDNIFIAIETAARVGIIKKDEPIILLEGAKQVKTNEDDGGEEIVYLGTLLKREDEEVTHEEIKVKKNTEYMDQDFCIAMDGSFLNLEPSPPIPSRACIFARVPPEDKANIIKKLKKRIKQKRNESQGKFAGFIKINKLKVGMCGDGANDLLALRQADLSLGIQESDASYGSSFTIKHLLDCDQILRQSKNTQANIIQLFQYYTTAAFFNVLCSIVMISDTTYYSSEQLMYLNFTSILIFPVVFAFSRPKEHPTTFVPDSNFMGLHNHLIYWGNILIPTAGIIGGYYYYRSTQEFQDNPVTTVSLTTGFHSQNHSATIVFLMVLIPFSFNAFFLYASEPWKERWYSNVPFFMLFLCNSSIAIVFFFITSQMEKAFQMVTVTYASAAIVLGIVMGSVLLSLCYNSLIRSFKLDHKVLKLPY